MKKFNSLEDISTYLNAEITKGKNLEDLLARRIAGLTAYFSAYQIALSRMTEHERRVHHNAPEFLVMAGVLGQIFQHTNSSLDQAIMGAVYDQTRATLVGVITHYHHGKIPKAIRSAIDKFAADIYGKCDISNVPEA